MQRAAAAAALALACACSEPTDPDRESPTELATSKPRLTLRADRLGPLDRTTRADRASLARALPDLRVESSGRRLRVRRGKTELFAVTPADDGSISSVEIVSRDIDTALGARVGDRLADLEKAGPLECNGGLDHLAGEVFCTPRRARAITYVFPVTDRRFAGDDIPPSRLRALLGDRRIRRILWRP